MVRFFDKTNGTILEWEMDEHITRKIFKYIMDYCLWEQNLNGVLCVNGIDLFDVVSHDDVYDETIKIITFYSDNNFCTMWKKQNTIYWG